MEEGAEAARRALAGLPAAGARDLAELGAGGVAVSEHGPAAGHRLAEICELGVGQ